MPFLWFDSKQLANFFSFERRSPTLEENFSRNEHLFDRTQLDDTSCHSFDCRWIPHPCSRPQSPFAMSANHWNSTTWNNCNWFAILLVVSVNLRIWSVDVWPRWPSICEYPHCLPTFLQHFRQFLSLNFKDKKKQVKRTKKNQISLQLFSLDSFVKIRTQRKWNKKKIPKFENQLTTIWHATVNADLQCLRLCCSTVVQDV